MSERYSLLKPFNIIEAEKYTVQLLNFFAPLNANKIRAELNEPVIDKSITPLSVNQFFRYSKEVLGDNLVERNNQNILQLITRLEKSNFLTYAGTTGNFSLGREKCYYFTRELTLAQIKNSLWLGECLGLEYVEYKSRPFVVAITGKSNGDEGIGTGTLINEDTILTCAHVINDMTVDPVVKINGKNITIIETKTHDKVDVGFIKIAESINLDSQLAFSEAFILDEVLTMGYPPIPLTKDAYIISQKGEVNSIIENYQGQRNFIYSSITRPGNSGGPVLSRRGYIVGISARHLGRESEREKDIIPFYEGISTTEVLKALKELDPNIQFLYEDFN